MVFEILSYFCVLTFWTVEFLYLHIIKGVEMLLLTDRFFFFFDLCQCLSFITVQRFSRFESGLLQNSCAYDLTMFLYIICKHFIQAKKDIEVIGNRVLHLISVGPICSTENIALKQRGGLVGA